MIRYLSCHRIFPLHHSGRKRIPLPFGRPRLNFPRSTMTTVAMDDGDEMREFVDYMEKLKNYERVGVPKGAGTDSDDGFDLGRMRRLLRWLGDPHLQFKSVHVAGTKGKGSTVAFLSSILREEGYSVGCYTSPHLLTIRERISIGKHGEPVSAALLVNLHNKVKDTLDQAMELENGALSHFEVFTALAFALFSQEKVDIAVIEAGLGGARDATNVLTSTGLTTAVITTIAEEHLTALGGSLESIATAKAGIIKENRPLVIGGPFEHHIESILRRKAFSMSSPVVSASDPRIKSVIKSYWNHNDEYCQTCDVSVDVKRDLPLTIELSDLNLHMVGDHQLQNAVTAICTALCLRNQGWRITDRSIRVGLEQTMLPGRGQFLKKSEIEAVGLSGISVLIDGAHTAASAKSLGDTIRKTCPNKAVALVVAMASDKDHAAFSRQLLSGLQPDIVLLTEASIAGSRSRITPASSLKDSWLHVAADMDINVVDVGEVSNTRSVNDLLVSPNREPRCTFVGYVTNSILTSMNAAHELLKATSGGGNGLIVVTGSLHVVSSVLDNIRKSRASFTR